MFETSHLVLRAYRNSDADALQEMLNTYSVSIGASTDFVIPHPESFKDTLRELINKWTFYAVVEEKATGAFVGNAALRAQNKRDRDALLGIALVPEKWGKGYGTEVVNFLAEYAFDGLGMHRVSLEVFANNERAIALYKQAGFVQEGVKRKAAWIQGKWVDNVLMGILEEDFRETQQQAQQEKP
ncbi:hypothetical protein EWM64_g7997 [Hericium alpestre]|uniref:N-acetyltransferase domain-containing protein n=1 Tax=Hericium alpestre TaxID=135208 RepID=A0A4Y9ZN27_9AGAM|nr:hypothetical protein EWM64_g7997 [Hericium alpestre]